ncbi:MAG TPA: hypothetical protein VJB35_02325 [Candidatus Nanoarchaeia archaeon]|nr:hypothetical protein [Candidatus Nanoarchaeia archaeon]
MKNNELEDTDGFSEEEISEMKEYFDKEIWPKFKKELKDMTKKEAYFTCFVAGSDLMRYAQEEEMKDSKEKLSKMSEEEIKDMLSSVLVDDKNGEVLKDE